MNKQFKLSIFSLIILLMGTMSVQAGPSSSLSLDSASASSDCTTVNVTWSHGSGHTTNITVYETGTSNLIGNVTVSGSSGTTSIDISPDLANGTSIDVLIAVSGEVRDVSLPDKFIYVKDDATFEGDSVTRVIAESTVIVTCTAEAETVVPPPVSLCADGRLTYTDCNSLAIYNIISDDGVGIIIYTSDEENNSLGEFVLEIPAETFSALPSNPEANCTIASSVDGTVVAYLLTTGEIQINAGPDNADNKVFVYIFSDLVSAPTSMDTYISFEALEILPSC